MWKKVIVGSLIIGSLVFSGCTQDQKKELKHIKSGFSGLNRTVTFYKPDGSIRTWTGKFKVEMVGSTASFITDGGKEVKVSPPYTIEEN